MTTEARKAVPRKRRLLRGAGILFGIVSGWFTLIAVSTVSLGPVGPAVLVLGPGVPASLPEGAGILRADAGRTVVAASDAAFVRKLYAHGAWLVLPALRNGCMDLRPA